MRAYKYLLICVLLALVGRTFADNLKVDDITLKAGETKEIVIELINHERSYTAFQFDFVLPEGITIAKNARNKLICNMNADRVDDHTLNVSDVGSNTYRFIAFSLSNAEIYDTEGPLIYVTLAAADDISTGTKVATIESQVITEVSGDQYKWGNVSFNIIIKPSIIPQITANNQSRKYGEENPSFTYSVTAEIEGVPELSTNANLSSPVGTYEITVGRGSVVGEYTAVNGTLTITKAPLTIKGKSYSIKQGQALPTFAATYSGFKNGETEAVLTKKPTLTTTATSASAPGTYDIIVSGAEARNYDISYVKGTLTITETDPVVITAKSYTRVYGDANPTFDYTSSGAELNGVPEISCEATATSPVGTYPIVIKKGGVTNYNDSYVNGTLTITKAPLTIKGGTYAKKQGEDNPEFTLTYEGFKNNETSAVLTKQPTATTTAVKDSPVGEYDVIVSGAEAKNYEITHVNGKLMVTAADAVIIIAKDYTRVYGDANPTFDYTSSGAALNGVPEISCEATATSPVGTYPIVIKKGGVTNYNDSYINGTLTITKAPLTIKAGTYSKKQGEDNPEFTLTYEGFKNNETSAVLTKQPTATTTATKSSPVGDYEVIVSGAEAQNYSFSYVNGTLKVTNADAVIVTAKSYTRVYGDANPTFEYTSSGATLNGTPEISCEATMSSPVGTYPIVIKKGGVTNYNDSYINGTLTITKAPLTIKAGTYSKEQGEDNPEFTLTYEGFKNNETSVVLTKQPTATTTAVKESPVGEYDVIVSGAEAQNYEIAYVNGKLTIVVPVGINDVDSKPNNGTVIYNLSGQLLSKPQRGVNIINGKKVLVK